MPEPINFAQLMNDVGKSRAFLDDAAKVMVGEQREQFDKLLSMIDSNIERAKTAIPDCRAAFQAHYDQLKEKHKANQVNLAKLKAEAAQLKQQIADGTVPKPAAPPEKPVAPQLGSFLRSELLAKFSAPAPTPPPTSGVAWQDWNLDGSWIADNPT